jgi:hypothetical protein
VVVCRRTHGGGLAAEHFAEPLQDGLAKGMRSCALVEEAGAVGLPELSGGHERPDRSVRELAHLFSNKRMQDGRPSRSSHILVRLCGQFNPALSDVHKARSFDRGACVFRQSHRLHGVLQVVILLGYVL